MTLNKKNLKKIKGDASFRTFYRKKINIETPLLFMRKKKN